MRRFVPFVAVAFIALGAASAAADDRSTCLAQSGDTSIAACTRAIGSGKFKDRDLVQLYSARAAASVGKGDVDRGIADINEAIRLDPKYAYAYTVRAAIFAQKQDWDRALVDYDAAIRFDPKSVDAYTGRGVVFEFKGDLDRALADHETAIRLNPNNAYSYAPRGIILIKKRQVDRALADFETAIRLDPKYAEAYIGRGIVFVMTGQLDRAAVDFNDAIRLDPKDGRGYYGRAEVLRFKGEPDRAISEFNEALRLLPTAGTYVGRAMALVDKGDLSGAMADFNQALALDPKSADAYAGRGLVFTRKGEIEDAIRAFDESIRLDKTTFAFGHRGLAYEKKGDLERARTDYATALAFPQKDPDDTRGYDLARERLAVMAKPSPPAAPPAGAQLPAAPPPATTASLPTRQPATSDRRIALVIGNSAYASFPKIPNPHNDAEDLAASLRSLGFDVLVGLDLDRSKMENIFIEFARKARQSDTALVFYAGHGIQHNGINYLAPVDAKLDDETDLRKLFNLQDVMNDLQAASHVRILIVDACRDNDAVKQLAGRLPPTRSAAFTRGLASVAAADGTLVAFATQPNRVAADGAGRNSPFTQALIKHLATPGLELRTLMTRVRADVVGATGGSQRPEVWDSLVGEFAFSVLQ